ncbi:MAG: DUF1295 domain-containing protein [Fidelibacterota bacterium]
MELNLWHYLLAAVGINILMFIPAYLFKTDKFTDLSYSLTFIILMIIAWILQPFSVENTLVTAMIVIWGLRLGMFLFVRIGKIKRDKRFDGIRESFFKFLQFWVLQGVSVWIILLPALLFIENEEPRLCYAGLVIWAIGLIMESIADAQKYHFTQEVSNKGKFIDTGLWKFSRHPNYFGEILCWIGIYLFVFLSFTPREMLIGLASPLYIIFILLFLTGIPTVEKRANEKWGDDPDYREYKRKTSILIPWFKKK